MIAPLRDKVEQQAAALEENSDKTNVNIRRLGRIVLDMERMDASMKVMRADIRKDIVARRRYYNEERKLLKKDIKQTEQLGTMFLGFRSVLAAVSGASALREFSQGDIVGGLQDSSIAITAMLPEITTAVLGAVGLALGLKGGRRGPQGGPKSAVPRGKMAGPTPTAPRGKMAGRLGLLSLIPLALLGGSMLMGRGDGADEKRSEITQQQVFASKTITSQDVDFFSATVSKFSRIVSSLLGKEIQDPTINIKKDDDGNIINPTTQDSNNTKTKTPQTGLLTRVNRTADSDAKKEALIQLVKQAEGTADADGSGYNKFVGGDTSVNITEMTGTEVMIEQKRRLASGEAYSFTDSTGRRQRSAAVGAGQFLKPEQIMLSMKLDPDKTKMTAEVQDQMILHLARKTRKVNEQDGIDGPEMERLGMEWAGLTSYHGQRNISGAQSIQNYNNILNDIMKERGEEKKEEKNLDPLGDQSFLPNIDPPASNEPRVAALAPEPPSPASITVDPNSRGTTGSEIASSALLIQYNVPVLLG
jgi:hypothetical protein